MPFLHSIGDEVILPDPFITMSNCSIVPCGILRQLLPRLSQLYAGPWQYAIHFSGWVSSLSIHDNSCMALLQRMGPSTNDGRTNDAMCGFPYEYSNGALGALNPYPAYSGLSCAATNAKQDSTPSNGLGPGPGEYCLSHCDVYGHYYGRNILGFGTSPGDGSTSTNYYSITKPGLLPERATRYTSAQSLYQVRSLSPIAQGLGPLLGINITQFSAPVNGSDRSYADRSYALLQLWVSQYWRPDNMRCMYHSHLLQFLQVGMSLRASFGPTYLACEGQNNCDISLSPVGIPFPFWHSQILENFVALKFCIYVNVQTLSLQAVYTILHHPGVCSIDIYVCVSSCG